MDTFYDMSLSETDQEEVDWQDLMDDREPDTDLCWDRNHLFDINCDLPPHDRGHHEASIHGVTFRWK